MSRVVHLKDPDTQECSVNCFGCKLETVSIQPSAQGTRFPQAARAALKDPLLAKDREAYKRLRRNGEQPKHVGGSAELEAKADYSSEIATGIIYDDRGDRAEFAKRFDEMPAKARVRTSPDEPSVLA